MRQSRFDADGGSRLQAFLQHTCAIRLKQGAQVGDLFANLHAGIGVAHHTTTFGDIEPIGLAHDIGVTRELEIRVYPAIPVLG